MKIAHVVTLVSPDGAYGGPVRVAVNQLSALADLGHEVTLIGGFRGFAQPPAEVEGIPARLFPVSRILPKTGFAGLVAPKMLRYLWTDADGFDVVHIHVARDLVTLPAARLVLKRKRPLIVQTHGMIDPSQHLLSRPLDAVWTRRTLRTADAVFHLTSNEREDLEAVCGKGANYVRLQNGVPSDPRLSSKLQNDAMNVLFLGRLHPDKRPLAFAEAARRLHGRFPSVTFSLVGPDEGEGTAIAGFIEKHGLEGVLDWEGSLNPSETSKRMAQSCLYVNPRIAETFAMATLEAAAVGVPIIATESSGISPEIARYGAGIVVGSSDDDLEEALATALADPSLLREMGANARRMVENEFSMELVAKVLEETYLKAAER